MFNVRNDIDKVIISTLFVLATVNCSPESNEKSEDAYTSEKNEEIINAMDLVNSKFESEGIVGGTYSIIREFPYLAQLVQFGITVCGAAIISERWLLTAGHCVNFAPDNIEYRRILVRATYREEGGRSFRLNRTIQHEKYNDSSLDNDIGLIQINGKIKFNNKMSPIEIAAAEPKPGDILQVAGWGKEGEDMDVSWQLKSAAIPVIDYAKCNEEYKSYFNQTNDLITTNMFCAKHEYDDTCSGDSGGPAVTNGKLVGIISWAYDCGSSKLPGVYTVVKHYCKWISKHTGLDLHC